MLNQCQLSVFRHYSILKIVEFHNSRHIPFFSLRSMSLLCFKTLIKIFNLETGAITLEAVGALTNPTEQRKCPFLKNPMFKEMRVKKVCLFLGLRQQRSSVIIFQLANQIFFFKVVKGAKSLANAVLYGKDMQILQNIHQICRKTWSLK